MKELPSLNNSFLANHSLNEICIAQGKRDILSKVFDFNVFLPSKGICLQRERVWTKDQKEALIESIIVRRAIPPASLIYTVDDVYQVIDGKQRLTTIIDYIQDEFEYCGYTYSNLPSEYQAQISRHFIRAYVLNEYDDKIISDDQKIEWFCWINFAGTPQDKAHLDRLRYYK